MTAYYNEFDPYAAEWLRNLIAAGLIADGDVDTRSITDVSPVDLIGYTQCHFFAGIGGWSAALRIAGWDDDRPVWTGSCPCQPFSAAGKRKGTADARHLWPEFQRLIAECNPPTVFGEQVASKDGRGWLAGVRADLEALGYAVGAADLCAASAGAPHIRQRLWWVADADRRGSSAGRENDGEVLGLSEAQRESELGAALSGRSGADGRRLADADGGLAGHGRLQPSGQHGQQPQDGGVGGMADLRGAGLEGRDLGEVGHERAPTERSGCAGDPRLEHVSSDGREQRRPEPSGRSIASGCGESGLGDSESVAGGLPVRQERREDSEPVGSSETFWSSSEWLLCTDGKARRIEPGTFPLLDGSAFKLGSGSPFEGKSRVGLLRAYGNAIVPPVAAAFITAWMECEP